MLNRVVRVAAAQAEPVWLDMEKTTDKVIEYLAEAAGNDAELIAFPETFIPGYPWQIWLDSPAAGMSFVPPYYANSPTADGPQIQRLAKAAAQHKIAVSLGYSERDGGSLYMGQALIDAAGTVRRTRRKLKPTHVERSVFGQGDGSDLKVDEFEFGNVGELCCWEHLQPLSKYAMYAQNEDIHCAAWPTFSLYKGAANALGAEVNNAASLMYAVEGGCFVLAPCGVIGDAGFELFCDTPAKEQMLQKGGGFARIYGPDGSSLAEPLPETTEGILYADCDPALQAISKSVADPAGHYSRPDVTRLLLNPNPVAPTVTLDEGEDMTNGSAPAGADADVVEV
ncbi:MAG: carbon-nitrogen hydrolase family protein [Actinomycetota bacterium]